MNFRNWRSTKTDFTNNSLSAHSLDEDGGSMQPIDLSQNFNAYAEAGALLEDGFSSSHVRHLTKKG